MGLNRSQHLDSVHQRLPLHLLHLLSHSQNHPTIRPINARHRVRLQGHGRQQRHSLRHPLHLLHTGSFLPSRTATTTDPFFRAMGSPLGGSDSVLRGLLLDVGLRCGVNSKAAGSSYVLLYVICGPRDDFFQHG